MALKLSFWKVFGLILAIISLILVIILGIVVYQSKKPAMKTPHLYTFGGVDIHGDVTPTAARLNETGVWIRVQNMSTPRASFCGAVIDHRVYLFGGINQNGTILKSAEVYDCLTDTYKPIKSMLEPREQCGAAVLNGYIYVAGGTAKPGPVSQVFRYSPKTDQWSIVSPMNNVNERTQLVQLNGSLYALDSSNLEVYDQKTDQWLFKSSIKTMYCYPSDFAATTYNGKIFVYICDQMKVYSEKEEWKVLGKYNSYRSSNLVSFNHKFWAVGGYVDKEDYWRASNAVWKFNPATNKWTQKADLDMARARNVAFVVYL